MSETLMPMIGNRKANFGLCPNMTYKEKMIGFVVTGVIGWALMILGFMMAHHFWIIFVVFYLSGCITAGGS